MFQALQLLTLNVQALIQAQIAHSANQNQTLTFQAPLTLLVTATTKTADIDQLFYNIFQMRLTPAELSYIYTMIENEKTKTLLWLKNLLPPNLQYPEILRVAKLIILRPFPKPPLMMKFLCVFPKAGLLKTAFCISMSIQNFKTLTTL